MNKKAKLFLSLASAAVLAACGNNSASSSNDAAEAPADVTKSAFPTSVENEGTPIEGGVLRYAIISDSPMSGILSNVYYDAAPDGEAVDLFDQSLFQMDENKQITDKGIGKLSYDLDNNTVTVSIRQNVKWSDGEPLTIDDYIYAFEVIGNKDYTGIRYDSGMQDIEGMNEYHAGTASSISGIQKVDDYTVTFKMKQITASIKQAGGFWAAAMPKHVFKDIPIADQAASDAVRKNPVGLGAFRVTGVVSGESVTYEANPYYWQGKPKLAGVVADVVNSTNSADEFKAGKYDMMSVTTQTSIYDSFKDINNGTLVGDWQSAITYLGFKLGSWDKSSATFIPRENAKLGDVRVRQAMAYALDMDSFASDFYGNLRVRANTLLTPTFKGFWDSTNEGYNYQPEKAKQLLDEAGYKDVDGDGYREDPNGNKFTVSMAFMAGGDSQTQADQMIKYWKEVGINVELTTGRPIEFNTFYKQVQGDDASIDLFIAAWSLGGDPTPDNLWGETSTNFTRFTNDKQKAALEKFTTRDMFDTAKQTQAFKEWQQVSLDDAFAIPLLYRTNINAINKRVKNYNMAGGAQNTGYHMHELQLTADQPYAQN